MEQYGKSKRNWFIAALFASFSLVAAVPGIIFSAMHGWYFLMAVAIAFAAFGFYGSPLFWVAFGNRCALGGVLRAVASGLLTVPAISAQLGSNPKTVSDQLRTAIGRGYLPGYVFDGTALRKIVAAKPTPISVVCPFCGATAEITGQERKCPWCSCQIPYPSSRDGA